MFTKKLGAAAVVLCIVVATSVVFAQDRRAERRERLRGAAEAAAGVADRVADRVADGAEGEDVVSGSVIMLQGRRAAEGKEVNVGGLVVVRVPDSGSRPPQDILADGGGQFQRIGEVRGVREENGQPQAGGGYTWVLFKPVTEGQGTIVLSFKPNEGEPVKREFKVNVTAPEPADGEGN